MLSKERNEMLTRVGQGTPMGELLRRYWIPALLSEELPEPDGRPVRIRLLGEDLVAFRNTSGVVGILEALCPHRRAPLYYARNEDDGLTCIYHGWKFDTDGQCLAMPNVPPEADFASRVKAKSYPAKEFNGIVWTYMGPIDTMPEELPPLDWVGLPPENRLITKQKIEANWTQVLEGDFDPSHISFLHGTVTAYKEFIGREPGESPPPAPDAVDGVLTSELERFYWRREPRPTITVLPTEYGMFSGARREAGPTTWYYRFNQFILPFYAGPPGDCERPAQCNIWVPMDDHTSIVWRVGFFPDRPIDEQTMANLLSGEDAHVAPDGYLERTEEPQSRWYPKLNRSNEYGLDHADPDHDYFAGIVGVWAQDRACTEGMGSILDRSEERLVSSDAPVAMVRRVLLRTARALAETGEAPPQQSTFPTVTAIPNTVFPREKPWLEISREVQVQVSREQAGVADPVASP
ncbi:Rieske 2Fe-2S domain-containing protein [Nakamurella sp. YIM 132087]|uniref:Rieske 2Fe-2S domain-containing protein n=1 Tax=Nakamurella alba TaxID=2665158 RepID=A0A7K1FE09_9ACTN|nr:Rieske 2Fe-2S domain-containing protein [Nakamurella alba]MTD12336.1 Rieske 2Fe-2S domain-containing protein [Nakamurella alba]